MKQIKNEGKTISIKYPEVKTKVEIVCDPYDVWTKLYSVLLTQGTNIYNERSDLIGKYSSKFKARVVKRQIWDFIKDSNKCILDNVLKEDDIDDGTTPIVNPFTPEWCEEEILDILSALHEGDTLSSEDFQEMLLLVENKKFDRAINIIEKWKNQIDEDDENEILYATYDDVIKRFEVLGKSL